MTDPHVIGVWLNDAELVEACRRRADDLSMSYDEIDRIAGLARGHTSKVLAVPQAQGFGPVSRFTIPWALQMKFAVVPAPEFIRSFNKRVNFAVRRGKKHHQVAKALAIVAEWGRAGGKKRFTTMRPDELRAHQIRAGKARWRKHPAPR